MAQTNSTPDIPEEDKKTKEQESLAALGFGDHRPLTTADIPAIAAFCKEQNKSRSSSSSRSKSSSNSKSAKGAKS